MRADMAGVTLRNVSKTFGGRRETVTAVNDLMLEVAGGELLVLVGPSGCGKTTTLRLIAGLDRPTAGLIEIDGRVVNDIPPKDRGIGMVFQDYALYPHMTVFDNLAFGLKMRRTPRPEIRGRVTETAELLGIESLLARRPHELSGGEQQRVALGRAIVRRPRVCLFDEPLASLDVQLRASTRRELKLLQRDLGMTAVYVTHDQQEAMAMGDRIAVMKNGSLQQVGRCSDVFDRPTNRFVAGFIGSPPMNFINARLTRMNGDAVLEYGGARMALPHRLDRPIKEGSMDVVAGVRPERVRLSREAKAGIHSASIPVRVVSAEPGGDRWDVFSVTGDGQDIVAKASDSMEWETGGAVMATFEAKDVVLFDPCDDGANMAASVRGTDVGGA